MKTRTLMLLALACGVAIMLAGAVFLFQLTRQSDVAEPVAVGASAQIGDMSVTITDFDEDGGTLRVFVTIGGTEDLDPADEFRLIASARPVSLRSSTCPAVDDADASCVVEFDVAEADGESRVLFYERGEEQARWVLDRSG
jgi:hypothetical protein